MRDFRTLLAIHLASAVSFHRVILLKIFMDIAVTVSHQIQKVVDTYPIAEFDFEFVIGT